LAWARLVRATDGLRSAIERDLKAAGFPGLSWYDVLLELDRSEGGALRPGELEKRCLVAQYNMSRLIDRLEKAGLVRREKLPEDGRGSLVCITGEGRSLRKRMWPAYGAAMQRHMGDRLSNEQSGELAVLLKHLLPRS
jgi:DNA-binding MarR family transcriptional regulator